MNKNDALNMALLALRAVDSAVDLRWLAEKITARLSDGYIPKLHGYSGGHEAYTPGSALIQVLTLMNDLGEHDLGTMIIVVDMLRDLMQPLSADSRGTVQLKTITRYYNVIDWDATGDGLPVYVVDENGQVLTNRFDYTYAYVRVYAGKGNADRKRHTLLSIYADRGMGKGGSGGYVATALDDGLITEDEILDAWHQGRDSYQGFIDSCADLLRGGGLGDGDTQPNPKIA